MNIIRRMLGLFLTPEAKKGRRLLFALRRVVKAYGPGLELVAPKSAVKAVSAYLKETGRHGLEVGPHAWLLVGVGVNITLSLVHEAKATTQLRDAFSGGVFA